MAGRAAAAAQDEAAGVAAQAAELEAAASALKAEVSALQKAFGDDLRKVLITNTKGITGHAMGVCFEDAVAVAALNLGVAPPVVHHKESDPVLGPLRLHAGGAHECRYALHFAAGFGSQVTYVLYRK